MLPSRQEIPSILPMLSQLLVDGDLHSDSMWSHALQLSIKYDRNKLLVPFLEKLLDQKRLNVLEGKYKLASKIHMTTLNMGVVYGNVDLVRRLLDPVGHFMEEPDSRGDMPIHWASYLGKLDILTLLLERKASVDIPGYMGNTALHCAVKKGRRDIVIKLFECGASIVSRDEEGTNVWDLARQHKPLIDLILIQMLSLPRAQQKEMLCKVQGFGGYHYNDVLEYARGTNLNA